MKVGDKVRCLGIGYPHMRNKVFTVTVLFDDNKTFGVMIGKCGIRLFKEDFEVIIQKLCYW